METNLGSGPLEPDHGIAGVGRLGESLEEAERERIEQQIAMGLVGSPVLQKARLPDLPPAGEVRALRLIVREQLAEVHGAIAEMRADIQASNRLLKHIDAPLETVADAHERATHSFETLRGEFLQVEGKVEAFGSRLDAIELLLRRIAKQVGVA